MSVVSLGLVDTGYLPPSIEPDQRRNGHENVDDVLDRRSEEVCRASIARHAKHIGDVVHHDVHARELRPDLRENADVSAVEHVRLKQFPVGDIAVSGLELAHLADIVEFVEHEWGIGVTLAVDESQHGMAVFPAVLACQPTWRLRKEEHEE